MKKKVLCCIAVVAILMCVVPVSVVAMDCNNNSSNNASNCLAENKMSNRSADQEIKFQGTAVSGDVGDFVWWRVAVDDVIFGPLSCSDTIAVYCGGGGVIPDAYIDPDITPGDKVEVYGYYTCTGHEFDYVEPYRSDHYIKRIEEKWEVKFQGTVNGTEDPHIEDFICEASVDKIISGADYIEEGWTVNIVLSAWESPCGTYEEVKKGDKIEVFGQRLPVYCWPPRISLCGRSSYYLKRIEEPEKCGEILNWESGCTGKYCPPKKIGADMWFQSLCTGGYNFKGVIIVKSQLSDDDVYTGSRTKWEPNCPNPNGAFLSAAGNALEVWVPEDAAPGAYDIKLQLWNVDIGSDGLLCDEIEWNESLFEILEPCEGTDTSCGCRPDCVNCNDHDGWHCKLDILGNSDIREYRDYYCSGRSCAYTVTSSENCNDYDCWVDTGNTKWVDVNECREKEQKEQEYRDHFCTDGFCACSVTDTQWLDTGNTRNKPDGTDCGHDGWKDTGNTKWEVLSECQEKEQKEQEYRDYYCSGGACTYSVTNTQWVDTGNTRNQPDGTICGCTARNTLKRCNGGVCTDTGICDSTTCGADAACDGKKPGESCGANKKCDSNCKCRGIIPMDDIAITRDYGGMLVWHVDTDRDGSTDLIFSYGAAGDRAVVGDINNDGIDDIAITRDYGGMLVWHVDTDRDGSTDLIFSYGAAGDRAVVGDINNDGIMDDIAITRDYGGMLVWHVDTDRDGSTDLIFSYGAAGDRAVVGDINNDGIDDIAITRDYEGMLVWHVDTDRDGSTDLIFSYGAAGDRAVVGDIG